MKKRADLEIDEIKIIAEKKEPGSFLYECFDRPYDGFVYFLRGEGTLTVHNSTLSLPVMDNMIFWFREGDSYRFRVDSPCHYVTSAYRIKRDTAGIASHTFPTATLVSGKTALLPEQLAREWESHRPASYMRCKMGILSLYTELLLTEQDTVGDPTVQVALDFIHQQFRRPFTGEELAAACALSPSYLRQKFRAAMGMGVTEYRDRLRVEAAQEMLASGLFSPKETAYELGYTDVYHFSKVFAAKVGVTPARYAKGARK